MSVLRNLITTRVSDPGSPLMGLEVMDERGRPLFRLMYNVNTRQTFVSFTSFIESKDFDYFILRQEMERLYTELHDWVRDVTDRVDYVPPRD